MRSNTPQKNVSLTISGAVKSTKKISRDPAVLRERIEQQKAERQAQKLAQAQAQKEEVKAEEEPEIKENQSFTPERAQEVWTTFFEKRKLSQAEKTFFARPIRIENEVVFLVPYFNILEEDMLKRHEDKLLAFLKRSLQNTAIQVQLKKEKSAQGQRKRFTRQEGFAILSQKYPLLEELRQRLGLELD